MPKPKRVKKSRPKPPVVIEPLREVEIVPLNRQQYAALKAVSRSSISFLLGPAGTGKTHLACGYAAKCVADGRVERIILTRPIVEAGESLGFLPGTFEEKAAPYLLPIHDALDAVAGRTGRRREQMRAMLQVAPLAYMRGRSQPLDAKVLTPGGYRTMGEINVGDEVVGSNGLPTTVLGVYPQGEIDVYRVTFSDHTSVECSGDHLWQTTTLNQRRSGASGVRTTLEIQQTVKNKHGQKVHSVPLASPVHFDQGETLPIDPYTLGALIGDGNFHPKACVTLCNPEEEITSRVAVAVAPTLRLAAAKQRAGSAPTYRVVQYGKVRNGNPIRDSLSDLGLRGKLSQDKFVPQMYLQASVQDRIDLLRGLMDTDGCVTEHPGGSSRVEFSSTSRRLAQDVQFLVHSLGGTASVRKREHSAAGDHEFRGRMICHRRPSYVVNIHIRDINPFYVSRKANRWKPQKPLRLIVSVEFVGRKPCQCIRVDADDSLYLTDHCIVTHNTFNRSIIVVDESQNCTLSQLKLVISRLGRDSQMILTGDLSQSDLRHHEQALGTVVNKLEGLPGVTVFRFDSTAIVRHPILAGVLERLGN
jgi:phosphate starvation-inducible PhoH-like protein